MASLRINGDQARVLATLEAVPKDTFVSIGELCAFVRSSTEREFRVSIESSVRFYGGDIVEEATVRDGSNNSIYNTKRKGISK